MTKAAKKKALKPRLSLKEKLEAARTRGHREGYEQGLQAARAAAIKPDEMHSRAINELITTIDAWALLEDKAVVGMFGTDLNATCGSCVPIGWLRVAISELRRFGYGRRKSGVN